MWKELKQSGKQLLGGYILPISLFVMGSFFVVMSRLTETTDLLSSAYYLSAGIFLFFFGIVSVFWIVFTHCLYCFRSTTEMVIPVSREMGEKTMKRRSVRRRK